MHRPKRWPARLGVILPILAAGAVLSVAGDVPASEPRLVGVLLPPDPAAAASLRRGALLAAEHASAAGGPLARVCFRGRPGQWGTEGDEAVRLALDDGAQALIAPANGASSHLTLQVSGRTAIPVVSLSADSSVTRAGIPWMLRIAPRTTDEAGAIFSASGASAGSAAWRWLAIVPDGRAGREAKADLSAAARASGARLANFIELPAKASDGDKVVREAIAAKPDGVLLWLDPSAAGGLAKRLRTAGFDGRLAGPTGLAAPAFLAAAGEAAEGVLAPAIARDAPSKALWRGFAAAYQAKHRAEPDLVAALAYDAASLLFETLRQAPEAAPHRAFPPELREGVSGALRFDREGNRVLTLRLATCQHGQFVPYAGLIADKGNP